VRRRNVQTVNSQNHRSAEVFELDVSVFVVPAAYAVTYLDVVIFHG